MSRNDLNKNKIYYPNYFSGLAASYSIRQVSVVWSPSIHKIGQNLNFCEFRLPHHLDCQIFWQLENKLSNNNKNYLKNPKEKNSRMEKFQNFWLFFIQF